MKQWRRLSGLLLSATMLFGTAGMAMADTAADTAVPEGSKHITLLHTNDVHSHVVANDSEMGYAKLAGIVDKYRGENPNTLLLDIGDAVHGTTFATLVNGESIPSVMNKMGYDAMVPGNHEFNYGSTQLVKLAGLMNFPMLSANVKKTDGTRLFEPYTIKEVDGVKIGLIALTTPETAYKTNPKNVEGIEFTDPSAEAKAIVDEIRDDVDVIVVLGHLGQDASSTDTSFKVIKEVPGIDIFIDGHSHTVLENGLVSDHGTLLASAGEYSKYLGVVDFWVNEGEVVSKKAQLIDQTKAADIAPNAEVAALIDSIRKEQEPILAQQVAVTTVELDGVREHVRAGETNLGDLIADALKDVSGADVALTNGGGIRASIKAGNVNKGDVITVLPFGNQVVTLEVTGADLKAALENGVASYPEPSGGFPQVSGMTFKIDASAAAGNRVVDLLVGGEAYDPAATYTLATNDFTASGGDQYSMFTKYPQAGMYGSLDEALIQYMQQPGTIAAEADGRISAVGASTTVPSPEPTPEPAAPAPTPAPTPAPQPTTPEPAATPKPQPVKPQPAKPSAPQTQDKEIYIVKSGDTLTAISKKYGTTWQQLQKLNKLNNPNLIYPGQKIILPAS